MIFQLNTLAQIRLRLQIKNLMEEIKPVVYQRFVFEYRKKSNITALLRFFRLQRL